jgi:hypothetical protein
VPKRGISERTPCLSFELETFGELHLTTANRRKLRDGSVICTSHEKTPSTLALGVFCQPMGSESSLPNVRLPDLDSDYVPSGEQRIFLFGELL